MRGDGDYCLNAEISTKAKDVIQKYAGSLFKDATLEFYGVKTAKIVELINVELPAVEVAGSSMDFVFLLEDDSYLHLEFQSSYNKSDLIRFANYGLRLYERDKRTVRTVIIYSSDVKDAPDKLDMGSLVFSPEKIMMGQYDGNAIFGKLNAKINSGGTLTDIDMLSLIFLPLMNHTLPRYELAANSIKLANNIPDKTKRDACVAAAVAFADKYLDKIKKDELMEVLRVSVLYKHLDEYMEREMKSRVAQAEAQVAQAEAQVAQAEARAEARAEAQTTRKLAKRFLRLGMSIGDVAEGTGLDEDRVRQLQEELNQD